MVAIADMNAGRAERERMVTLAVEHGWVQGLLIGAAKMRDIPCVAVLATHDAALPAGLVAAVEHARKAWRLGMQHTRRVQRLASCPPFVVLPVPLEYVRVILGKNIANDLQTAVARNEYAVLCMNADREVLISGVSPIGKDG